MITFNVLTIGMFVYKGVTSMTSESNVQMLALLHSSLSFAC